MQNKKLIRILRKVPETRLRIIELAWKVVKADGSVDHDKLIFHGKELEECKQETLAYSDDTRKAVQCLRNLVHSQD